MEHQRQKEDFYLRNRDPTVAKTGGEQLLNMTAFGTQFFEIPPPDGLYKVDVGTGELADFGHL